MKNFKSLLVLIALVHTLATKAQITATAVVNHASPSSTTSLGSISLNVSGGTAPYTYNWSPGGATTQNITGIARNDYSVTIIDALGTSVIYPYSLGYKTKWLDYNGFSRNDSVFPGATLLSKNILRANNDGWSEVILTNTYGYFLGFSDSSSLVNLNMTYGIYINYYMYYYSEGPSSIIAVPQIGDVVRIERIDTTFNIKLNGAIIFSTPVDKTKSMKLVTNTAYAPFANTGASFNDSTNIYFANYVQDYATIKHCTPGSNNGSISLTPRLSGATNTHTWAASGATASAISSLSVSAYSVKAEDANHIKSYENYNVGYKTYWKDVGGLSFRNDSLLAGSNAISKNTLLANTDGWAEFTMPSSTSGFLFGFSDSLSITPAFNDLDFGLYVNYDYIYLKAGGYFNFVGYATKGDIIRLERVDTVLNFKLNGSVFGTQVMPKTKVYKLFASINRESISNVGASFFDSTGISFANYLKDVAFIRHTTPGLSNGSISLTSTDHGAVYSHTFSPGSYTANPATGLAFGTYTVLTQDADLNTSLQYFNVDYKAKFTNLKGMALRNDSLIPTSGYLNTVTKNTLKANTDGWSEVLLDGSYKYYVLGFTDSLSYFDGSFASDIDFGFYKISDTYIYGIDKGVLTSLLVLFPEANAVYRIERVDTVLNLKANGITIYTSNRPKNRNYKLKANLNSTSDTLWNVGVSFADSTNINFPNYVRSKPFIKHSSGLYMSDGSVTLTSKYKYPGNSYYWPSDGTRDSVVVSKGRGDYQVVVTDTLRNTSTQSHEILYKARWTDLDSCRARNDSLITPGGGYGSWSTAVSINNLKAHQNGKVSWVVEDVATYRMFGFADTTSGIAADYTDIDQGFYQYLYNLYYLNNGSYSFICSIDTGDVLTLSRVADTVYFFINGYSVKTGALSNTGVDWKVKAVMYPGSSIANIGCSFITGFVALNDRDHADYNNPINGTATVIPTGGVLPYKSVWSDGVTSITRTDLYPGTYTVVIYADSTADSEEFSQVITIGTKPDWTRIRNAAGNTDSMWVHRTDSLGVLIGDNMIDKHITGEYELKINNMDLNMAFGFLGSAMNVTYYDSTKTDSVLSLKTNLAYSLMRKAIHDSLSYTPLDSILNLSSDYNDIHLVRLHHDSIQLLLRGNYLHNTFTYHLNDHIKLGRDSTDGKIYLSRNDTVLYRHSMYNADSEYLLPVSVIDSTNHVFRQAILLPTPLFPFIPAPEVYAVTKHKLDGGYYTTQGNKLRFIAEGEYNQMNVKFKIYDHTHTVILSNTTIGSNINTTVQSLGDNRYTLSFPSLTYGFYTLEVSNEKNEKSYLRFNHAPPSVGPPAVNPN